MPSEAATPPPRLEARDVVVVRAGRRVLEGASFAVRCGEIVTLEGPSGCGKTTLLRVLGSLIDAEEGSVRLDGVDARTLPPRTYRTRVAYVSQEPPMLEGSVLENVSLGPRLRGATMREGAAAALLGRVGLEGFGPRVARDLSGGEKQRVALARALANDPGVLLLDEPTSALDPAAAARVLELVRDVAATGLAVVVVTHTAEHAASLLGTRYRVEQGRVRLRKGAP